MIPFEIVGFCFLVVVIMIVKIYVRVLLIALGVVSAVWFVIKIPDLLSLAAAYGYLAT